MIYIIHGEDFTKSRLQTVNQQKKLNIKNKRDLHISEISPSILFELLHTKDLFGNIPFIVLDISGASISLINSFMPIIEKAPETCILAIISNYSLPSTNPLLKNAHNLKAKIFENKIIPEGNVFNFLDALFLKNRKNTYKQMNSLLEEGYDPFKLFFMINYGMRNIAYKFFNCPGFEKLHSFQKNKISKQAMLFSPKKIIKLFDDMYTLDKKTVTGELSSDLLVTMAVEKVLNS